MDDTFVNHIFIKLNTMQIQIITVDAAKNTSMVVHQRQAGQGPIKHTVQVGQKVILVVDGVTLTGAQTVAQQKLKLVKNGNDLIVETADGSVKLVELNNFTSATDATLFGDQWVIAEGMPLQSLADGVAYSAAIASASIGGVAGATAAGATAAGATVAGATVAGATVGSVSGLMTVLGGTALAGAASAAGKSSGSDPATPITPVVPAAPTATVRDTDGDGLPTIGGTTLPGATVTIVDSQGRSHTVVADGSGNYSLELSSAPNPLIGSYVVTATDAAGNTSLPTTVSVSDLFVAAPTVTVSNTDGDGLPTISGTTEPGATVTIVDPQGRSQTVTADGSGNYSLELSTAPTPLTGSYVVTATDAAGNTSLPTTATTVPTTIDRTAPSAPTATVLDTDGDGLPTISGTAEPGSTVTIVDPQGRTHTVAADATTGAYSLELATAPLPPTGNYVVTATDAAGNTSLPTTVTTGSTATDLTAPDAPTATVSDTDGDGLPTISGTAEPGSTVTIVDPEGRSHTVVAHATTGAYSLELTSAPTPLTGNYVVTATDAAGNTSAPTTLATTDLTAPTAPTATTVRDTDGDGIPTISGTAEAGSTVTIVDPEGRSHTVVAHATTGAYSLELASAPTPLTGNYVVIATDAAGNTSAPTTLATTDLTAPTAPTATTVRDTDGDGLPTISGTAEAGSTVTIVDPEGRSHTVVAHATTGAFSLELTSAPNPLIGDYVVTAADAAGNTSLPTTVTTTDLTAPTAPTATTVRDTDGDGLPTISGTAEPGSTVTIVDPEGRSHTVVAHATTGAYSLELTSAPTPLTGNYVVTATDAAGNTSLPTTIATTDLFVAPPGASVRDTDGDGLPTISGTAEPGSTVTIVDPEGRSHTVVAHATTGAFGLELTSAPNPLIGNYVLTATDAAGNTSAPTTLAKTDLTAPAAPTSVNVRDTDGDGIPTISGTAEPGSTVTIVDPQGRSQTVVTHATTGAFSLELTSAPTPLTGNYVVTATDVAGNTGLPTTVTTTDLTAPAAPTVNAVITNSLEPVLSGTATLGLGETLTVSVNGATYANVAVAGNVWTIDTSSATPTSGSLVPFVDGQAYNIVATTADAAGNSASDSSSNELTYDVSRPSAPMVRLDTDTGLEDFMTTLSDINVLGLEGNATWRFSVDRGNTWTNGTGTTLNAAPGVYNTGEILVIQTDQAGNDSAEGLLRHLETDNTANASITTINGLNRLNDWNQVITQFPDGGYSLVWESAGTFGSRSDIYTSVYNANHELVSTSNRLLGDTASTKEDQLDVAANHENFVVVWRGATASGSTEIYTQSFDLLNNPLGPAVVLHSTPGRLDDLPKIAALSDGTFAVTWRADTASNGYDIYVRNLDQTGVPTGAVVQLQGIAGNHTDFTPQISAFENGDGYIVSWSGATGNSGQGNDIFHQRFNNDGSLVAGVVRHTAVSGLTEVEQQCTILDSGDYVFVWRAAVGGVNGDDIVVSIYDAANQLVRTDFLKIAVAPIQVSTTQITALTDGGFLVSWTSGTADSEQNDICTQRYDDSYAQVGGIQRLQAEGGQSDLHQQVTALADGGYVVAWRCLTSTSDTDIFFRQFDARNDAVTPMQRIERIGSDAALQIIADPEGYVITWSGQNDVTQIWDVMIKRFDLDGSPITVDTLPLVILNGSATPVADIIFSNDLSPILTGTAQLQFGETLTVQFNGATYTQVKPYIDGTWSIDTSTDVPTAGAVGVITDGQSYDVVVSVIDPDGNSVSDATVAEFTWDISAPNTPHVTTSRSNSVTPVISGAADHVLGDTVTVVFNGATYTNVPIAPGDTWTLDTSAVTPTSGTLGAFVNGQSYSIQARAIDRAGNSTVDTTNNEFTFDTSPPTVTIGGNGSTGNITFVFSQTPVGFDETKIQIANGTKGALSFDGLLTYTLAVTPSMPELNTNIAIDVLAGAFSDLAGNLNTLPASNETTIASKFMAPAFAGNITNIDVSHATSAVSAFDGNTSFNQDISGWNTVNIAYMAAMFRGASSFNQNIGNWNTGKTTQMQSVFNNASSFNQDLSAWDVSKVTTTTSMFQGATIFNQNLSAWDVSNVLTMNSMFQTTTAFNGQLNWGNKTAKVTTTGAMFAFTSAFNQDIGGWDTSGVTNMNAMFRSATAFNQASINNWDTKNVTNMSSMFNNATQFNAGLNAWDTSKVTNMLQMFQGASVFNGDISAWNTGLVTTMSNMFTGAAKFNQNIGAWNTAEVTNMFAMFQSATDFNANITSWNTANVSNMQGMFQNNVAFNQDIGDWNTANVTNMQSMFFAATGFNQDIGGWNVSKLTNASTILSATSGMSVANIDKMLAGWADVNTSSGETALQTGTTLSMNGRTYTDATSVQFLKNTYNWDITLMSVVVGVNVGNDATGDTLTAGAARIVHGLGGNDTITGSADADTLVGGAGNDTLTGNAGSDTFRYHFTNEGVDTIMDFNRALAPAAGGDVLDLHYLLDGATAATIGNFIQLVDNGGDVLRFDVDANGAAAGGTGVSIVMTSNLFSDASGGHVAFLQDMITQGNLVI
jgi:surface protein